MPTIPQNLPDAFSIEAYQKTFTLRPVSYPEVMPLLYRWMHAEHVVDQWQLHLPTAQLKAHFESMMISKFMFEHTEAKIIVVEPDSKVEVCQWNAVSFGYRIQHLIEMPEKTVSLYFCTRDEFLESRGYLNFYDATA